MSFRLPSVIVYQEYLTSTISPTLPFMDLCIVGPVYQCLDGEPLKDYTVDKTQDYTSLYPTLKVGAEVDVNSVRVVLSDVYVKIWPFVDPNNISNKVHVDNTGKTTKVRVVTGQESFMNKGIAAGDIIDLIIPTGVDEDGNDILETKSNEIYSYEEIDVSTPGENGESTVHKELELTLRRNIDVSNATGDIQAIIKRNTKEDHELPVTGSVADAVGFTATPEGITIDHNVSVASDITGGANRVVNAKVKVSLRALRLDVANDFLTITSYSSARAQLGDPDINNPMSIAAQIINSAIGDLSYRVLPIASDDLNGYNSALQVLSNSEKVYVIVPLTDDKDVISAFATHCTSMSTPENSMWRIMYANMPQPTTKVMIEFNDGELAKNQAGTEFFLKDQANGKFITTMCRPGDLVDIYANTSAKEYLFSVQITEIDNDTVADIGPNKWIRSAEGYTESTEPVTASLCGDIKYEVVRVLDIQGKTEALSEIAKGFKSKRVRFVQPDLVEVNVNSVAQLLPGYYLCVALGAMRAGFPPHQGFSTMGISGISRIYHANKEFNRNQLAEMAQNGVFWVEQEEPSELPAVVYQTTTDTSQLETIEDSCVAVVDYASKYYKDNLHAVLGGYNVNSISLNYVKNVINACTDDMTTQTYEKIGPILTSGTLLALEAVGDKIKPTIKIGVPYPVNGVDVTLQV